MLAFISHNLIATDDDLVVARMAIFYFNPVIHDTNTLLPNTLGNSSICNLVLVSENSDPQLYPNILQSNPFFQDFNGSWYQ